LERQNLQLKIKFALGLVTLLTGLWAANMALFNWVERQYLLGKYARYICAYGGFAAIIFGAMLINDFLLLKNSKRQTKNFDAPRDVEREREKIVFEQKT
jgi:hypothetical protein